MEDRILVFKSKRGRKEYKVTRSARGRHISGDCSMVINLENYKDLVLFMHDLEDLWNAPIEKAAKQYLLEKDTGWPF